MNRRSFLLCAGGVLAPSEPQSLEIRIEGKLFTAFHYGSRWDKPFLHPLRTASGKVISRGFPLEKIEGESADHAWHRGIWWGHGDVNGEDFWRELGPDKSGRIVVKAAPRLDRLRLRADAALRTRAGIDMGSVELGFSFSQSGADRLLDARIAILADRGAALRFGDTEDGGFGVRLSEAFREDRGARLRNSEGGLGTKEIWGKPARWVDYSAIINGKTAGVAMFDYPKNLRHPTGWHARGYSLCAANPFALGSFSKDKTKDGSHTLAGGARLEFRYRVIIYEGQPDIEALYRQFTSDGPR